jgi:hypothetical protein
MIKDSVSLKLREMIDWMDRAIPVISLLSWCIDCVLFFESVANCIWWTRARIRLDHFINICLVQDRCFRFDVTKEPTYYSTPLLSPSPTYNSHLQTGQRHPSNSITVITIVQQSLVTQSPTTTKVYNPWAVKLFNQNISHRCRCQSKRRPWSGDVERLRLLLWVIENALL